eukprot:TRINITY_DN2439_c0_g1_i4.p1 TRINITY_DN2439_c0_g1~~TRINITY_DN2439_c0_g1_i4.p1  ORF type:complete len:397 (+),score=74.17 TRINITY_DN2439_c0_g1_i4:62-1192(+)
MKAAAVLCMAHTAFSAAITWPPEFTYDTVPNWAFPGRTNQMLNSSMLDYYSKFQLIDVSGVNLTCYEGNVNPVAVTCPGGKDDFVGNQEIMQTKEATEFRKIKSQSYIFPYVYFGCSQAWHQSGKIFDERPQWWVNETTTEQPLTCKSFGYAFDFTIPDVQQFFLNEVVKPFLVDDTAGVFFDAVLMVPFTRCLQQNCTEEFISKIRTASLDVMRSTCRMATQMGKIAIMSFNSRHIPQPYYDQAITILAEEKGMHYYEFFCAWQGLDCLSNVFDMMRAVSLGIPIQAHVPFSPGEDIQFKLGSFLLAMGNHTYFSWGKADDWTLGGFPWVPEYDKKLGNPLGPAQNQSNIWWRHFEHASVRVDFEKSEGNITWSQ